MSTVSQHNLLQSDTLIDVPPGSQSTMVQSQAWQALRIYFFYRFALAMFLVWAVYSGKGPSMIAAYDRAIFIDAILAYSVLLGLSAIPLYQRKYHYRQHAYYHLALDLCCIPLLIHSSGGIGSGLEALLLMSVAASGLLIGGLNSVGFAALCSLVFLGEVVYSNLHELFGKTHYTEASVLGICSFAVSLFSHSLGRRAEQSERLANQRGRDIDRLEKLNAHIIQNLQSGVIIIDPVSGVQSINQSALKFFNLEQAPRGLLEISNKLDQNYLLWMLDNRQDSFALEVPNGTTVLTRIQALETAGKPYHMVWFEDYSVETQRIQQAKLVSLGHLAASIAHEIRNPLNVISHASQLLDETPDLNQETQKLSRLIIRHASRVNKIIHNMLQLAQRKPARLELVELNQWVNSFVEKFSEYGHMDQLKLEWNDQSSSDFTIRVDPSQLKQIMTNLCSNAIKHSVKSTELVKINLTEFEDKILIDVIDDGAGITEQNRMQLFEPFFTTSETGTGLGLYISRELAELNQARLDYMPRAEGGSVFRLSFPKHVQQVISL